MDLQRLNNLEEALALIVTLKARLYDAQCENGELTKRLQSRNEELKETQTLLGQAIVASSIEKRKSQTTRGFSITTPSPSILSERPLKRARSPSLELIDRPHVKGKEKATSSSKPISTPSSSSCQGDRGIPRMTSMDSTSTTHDLSSISAAKTDRLLLTPRLTPEELNRQHKRRKLEGTPDVEMTQTALQAERVAESYATISPKVSSISILPVSVPSVRQFSGSSIVEHIVKAEIEVIDLTEPCNDAHAKENNQSFEASQSCAHAASGKTHTESSSSRRSVLSNSQDVTQKLNCLDANIATTTRTPITSDDPRIPTESSSVVQTGSPKNKPLSSVTSSLKRIDLVKLPIRCRPSSLTVAATNELSGTSGSTIRLANGLPLPTSQSTPDSESTREHKRRKLEAAVEPSTSSTPCNVEQPVDNSSAAPQSVPIASIPPIRQASTAPQAEVSLKAKREIVDLTLSSIEDAQEKATAMGVSQSCTRVAAREARAENQLPESQVAQRSNLLDMTNVTSARALITSNGPLHAVASSSAVDTESPNSPNSTTTSSLQKDFVVLPTTKPGIPGDLAAATNGASGISGSVTQSATPCKVEQSTSSASTALSSVQTVYGPPIQPVSSISYDEGRSKANIEVIDLTEPSTEVMHTKEIKPAAQSCSRGAEHNANRTIAPAEPRDAQSSKYLDMNATTGTQTPAASADPVNVNMSSSVVQTASSTKSSTSVNQSEEPSRSQTNQEVSSVTQTLAPTKPVSTSASRPTVPTRPQTNKQNLTSVAEIYLQSVTPLEINPPPLNIEVPRAFLRVTYGGSDQQFLQFFPPERNPSGPVRRQLVFPQLDLNPVMPSSPGQPGLVFASRHEILDNPPWTVFCKRSNKPPAVWLYLGEYKSELAGKLTPEQFKAQSPVVQQQWARSLLKCKNFDVYVSMRARVALKLAGILPVDGSGKTEDEIAEEEEDLVQEEIAAVKKDQGHPVDETDLVEALKNGDEGIDIIRMNCVAYDHVFANDMQNKLRGYRVGDKTKKITTVSSHAKKGKTVAGGQKATPRAPVASADIDTDVDELDDESDDDDDGGHLNDDDDYRGSATVDNNSLIISDRQTRLRTRANDICHGAPPSYGV